MTADPFPPTPKGPRTSNIVNVRLKPAGFGWLRGVCETHQVDQSEVLRAALAFAASRSADFDKLINDRKKK